MKTIVLLCLVAVAFAAPPPAGSGREVQLLKSEFEMFPEGNYVYQYSQDDGTSVQAKGEFRPGTGKDGDGGAVVASGEYEWVGPDGVTYTVTYTADENGFQPRYTYKNARSGRSAGKVPDAVTKRLG